MPNICDNIGGLKKKKKSSMKHSQFIVAIHAFIQKIVIEYLHYSRLKKKKKPALLEFTLSTEDKWTANKQVHLITDENECYREKSGQVSPPLTNYHEFDSLVIRNVYYQKIICSEYFQSKCVPDG